MPAGVGRPPTDLPEVGDPEWFARIRRYLNMILGHLVAGDEAAALELLPSLDRLRVQAEDAGKVEEFDRIATDVFGELEGAAEAGLLAEGDMVQDLLDALGAGGTVTENIQTYITEREKVARETTRYIDVPTAEEFLDDFRTAFMGHIQTFADTGEMGRAEIQWAQANWDLFASEYMGELAKAAEAGEDIFKIVGLEGAPELVGRRPGEQVTEETALTRQTKVEGTTAPGGTVGKYLTQIARTYGLSEEEILAKRPKLGLVYAKSPLDFLREKWGKEPLELFVRGHIPSARPSGGGVGGFGKPRRVGG